jgi:hypothetical protein
MAFQLAAELAGKMDAQLVQNSRKKMWSLKFRTLQEVTAKHNYGVTQRVTEFSQSKIFSFFRVIDFIFTNQW